VAVSVDAETVPAGFGFSTMTGGVEEYGTDVPSPLLAVSVTVLVPGEGNETAGF
jgi:hypothetical protein